MAPDAPGPVTARFLAGVDGLIDQSAPILLSRSRALVVATAAPAAVDEPTQEIPLISVVPVDDAVAPDVSSPAEGASTAGPADEADEAPAAGTAPLLPAVVEELPVFGLPAPDEVAAWDPPTLGVLASWRCAWLQWRADRAERRSARPDVDGPEPRAAAAGGALGLIPVDDAGLVLSTDAPEEVVEQAAAVVAATVAALGAEASDYAGQPLMLSTDSAATAAERKAMKKAQRRAARQAARAARRLGVEDLPAGMSRAGAPALESAPAEQSHSWTWAPQIQAEPEPEDKPSRAFRARASRLAAQTSAPVEAPGEADQAMSRPAAPDVATPVVQAAPSAPSAADLWLSSPTTAPAEPTPVPVPPVPATPATVAYPAEEEVSLWTQMSGGLLLEEGGDQAEEPVQQRRGLFSRKAKPVAAVAEVEAAPVRLEIEAAPPAAVVPEPVGLPRPPAAEAASYVAWGLPEPLPDLVPAPLR